MFLFACNRAVDKKPSVIISDTSSIINNDTIVKKRQSASDTFDFDLPLQQFKYKTTHIKLAAGDSFNLRLPEEYKITVAAEGLGRLRFLAKSSDGKLFATDMHDRSDNKKGRVILFDEWDDSSRKFRSVITYTDSLRNPNQAVFYKGYIYIAETGRLIRYKYTHGDKAPGAREEVVATFPDYGLSYKYGGWHLTRSLAFHHDKLYVSVGSSCNACIEKEDIRATIIEMNPDGSGRRIYARGLRNSVGLKWIGNTLWATGMGRDLIGPDKPEDLFQQINENGYYGWPYYFQYKGKIYADPQFKDSIRNAYVKDPPVAKVGFLAHSAPLGFEYFKDFSDPKLKGRVLVALHGSTSVWRQRGNSIVMIGDGKYVDFISGFLDGKTELDRHGRPCDILMWDDSSFFFTDDHKGVLYYVWRED